MPGLEPFLPSLTQTPYVCTNCGFWQRYFDTPPSCPLCLDARHVLPTGGWEFLNAPTAATRYPCHIEELHPGVHRIWNDPVDGIGAMSYFVQTDAGNFMFEGTTHFSDAVLEQIESMGGVAVLSASHPHSYGALLQIQDRFEPELALHPGDFTWSAALRITWPFDDRVEVLPGITLHHTGGHFDGQTAAYVADSKILMVGDALKFELDPNDRRKATTISSHKAFVRGVPSTPAELRRYRDVFASLDFTRTFTPFEQVVNSGRREALHLIDSLLSTRPHAEQVPLDHRPHPDADAT